jgi:hypothetical protein
MILLRSRRTDFISYLPGGSPTFFRDSNSSLQTHLKNFGIESRGQSLLGCGDALVVAIESKRSDLEINGIAFFDRRSRNRPSVEA